MKFMLIEERNDSMETAVHQIVRDSENDSFNTSHQDIFPYFHMIQNGETEQLMNTLDIRLDRSEYQRKIGKDRKKELEYMAVSLVNTFMIAAIQGGVFPQEANWIADRQLQKIADCGDISKASDIIREAAYLFCEKVRAARSEDTGNVHVEKARRFIQTHLTQDISIEDIAEAAGISRYHLSRLFRERSGKTIVEYLRDERISAAKELLVLTDKSIAEIAQLLRFCDQSYFIAVFRRNTSMTPNTYRKANG
ncbi:MAG: AraC family transcriptional regulator [Solobacterium sp.]|nr:AraC family transcriptional regulator [Solobacterium sp.]